MPVQQMQDNMSNNMQMAAQQQDFKMAEVRWLLGVSFPIFICKLKHWNEYKSPRLESQPTAICQQRYDAAATTTTTAAAGPTTTKS